jgi:ADP-heptose:LPS heptosyltransferase
LESRTALVLLLPGLGDALAASPILRGLSRAAWRVDVMTMLEPVSEYARALGTIRDVVEMPLLARPSQALTPLWRLRSRRYDLCVLPFPATRWQYAAVARAVGARELRMHEYGGIASAIARTTRNGRLGLRGGHRIAENLRLARALGLERSEDELEYLVPLAWRRERIAGLLGIHPGSMAYKGNETKRWPYDRFVELARRQARSGRQVRFFLGPNEADDAPRIERALEGVERVGIVREALAVAARSLAECEVFVGNDAGFTHLASGLGVKTLGLFGMTSEVRGIPVGPGVAFRPSACPACHDEGMHGFDCVLRLDYRCIVKDIELDAVMRQVDQLFQAPSVEQRLSLEGPFKLYGKIYS